MIFYQSGGLELLCSARGEQLMPYFEKHPGKYSFLITYFYINEKHMAFLKKYRSLFKNVMLDSGAFSAFTSGKPVNLENYCEFVKTNKEWFTSYIALDVIGDKKQGQESYDNFITMRNKGLSPIPVFHPLFDNYEWFAKYAGIENYIGLGGLAGKDVDRNAEYRLLDKVFTDMNKTRQKHDIYIKTHGFGIGSKNLVARYPWYTCDSSSVLQLSVRGLVNWKGKVFSVSGREVDIDGHFQGLPSIEQKAYRDWLGTEFDITVESLAEDDALRYLVSIVSLVDFIEPLTNYKNPITFGEQLELF